MGLNNMKWTIVFCVLAVLFLVEAKQLSRCELVRELRKNGFTENKLRDWVCLVESESGRRTDVVTKNSDGTKDYGLFQINEKWCSNTNKPGKDCHVTCKQLIANDISKAGSCAKKIYLMRGGFKAWFGWQKQCRGKALPDISSCKK